MTNVAFFLVCGGTYNNENGIIASPMYPLPYHKDRECIYEIVAPLGKSITLDWMDFDVEGNTYPECNYDRVEVYDGVPDDANSLGRYCGHVMPPQAISKMNLMTLKFVSDVSIEGRGWRGNYSFTDTGKCKYKLVSQAHLKLISGQHLQAVVG